MIGAHELNVELTDKLEALQQRCSDDADEMNSLVAKNCEQMKALQSELEISRKHFIAQSTTCEALKKEKARNARAHQQDKVEKADLRRCLEALTVQHESQSAECQDMRAVLSRLQAKLKEESDNTEQIKEKYNKKCQDIRVYYANIDDVIMAKDSRYNALKEKLDAQQAVQGSLEALYEAKHNKHKAEMASNVAQVKHEAVYGSEPQSQRRIEELESIISKLQLISNLDRDVDHQQCHEDLMTARLECKRVTTELKRKQEADIEALLRERDRATADIIAELRNDKITVQRKFTSLQRSYREQAQSCRETLAVRSQNCQVNQEAHKPAIGTNVRRARWSMKERLTQIFNRIPRRTRARARSMT